MGRQRATAAAQTGDGSDHGERTHPTAPQPIDAKPTPRAEKKTNWEREKEKDPSIHPQAPLSQKRERVLTFLDLKEILETMK